MKRLLTSDDIVDRAMRRARRRFIVKTILLVLLGIALALLWRRPW